MKSTQTREDLRVKVNIHVVECVLYIVKSSPPRSVLIVDVKSYMTVVLDGVPAS